VNSIKSYIARTLLIALAAITFSIAVFAQGNLPGEIKSDAKRVMSVASGNNLYCAGYIQNSAISTGNKIIGGQDEADKYNYSQNDFLYINMGRDKGVKIGDMFAVVRPRGAVKSKWSKKSDIGFYVQEVGALEVIDVKQTVAVTRVKASCDSFLLGDLVQLVEKRTSPAHEERPPLDRFADPSGKAMGRILMSRDGAEMLTRDFIVYVDLGADDSVRVGDRLTIFRPLDKGNPTESRPGNEEVTSRDYGFQSLIYKGGKFSNQSGGKSGDKAGGNEVTTSGAKSGRPDLRKVVGEAIVLNVKEKTATVVIVRTGQEIHTGDWVEIQ
jgi:hypothetical protein